MAEVFGDDAHDDAIAELMETVDVNVRQFGWHCQGVFPTARDGENVYGYTYTVGFWRSFHKPEIIVTGLGHRAAWSVLEGARVWMVAEEHEPEPGTRHDGILQDLAVEFRPLSEDQRHEHLRVARRFYDDGPFDALQLVWPDPAGRFPWEPEWAYDDPRAQPLLAI